MTSTDTCPRCGASIPPGTNLDDCPKCLLQAGLPSEAAPAGEDLTPLFPELEILDVVGRGGMGVVYRVRQKSLDRVCALKVLPPELAEDRAFAERFGREARTMARLDHPNIVRVHDFGEREGRFFLLMEFVDGPNLRQVIDRGGLQPAEALRIVPAICEALQYAHDRGVVHRDVKPANVLLDRGGRVKITDFGLAKLVTPNEAGLTLTRTGQVMGTPRYMAPEQMLTPDDVDHRADLYSLGVVFYEMLTGDLPLGRFDPPSSKVEVDVRLDEVVLRTLEREREQRYQRAEEIGSQVSSIAARPPAPRDEPPRDEAPPPHRPEPSRPKARLSRMAVWGFVLALAPLVLGPLLLVPLAPASTPSSGSVIVFLPLLVVGAVLAGFVLSLVAWIRIARSDGTLKGLGFAVPGTLVAGLLGLPALMTLFLFLGRREIEEPPHLLQPDVPAPFAGVAPEPLGTDHEDALREIAAMWDDLQQTLRRPKLVPSDLHRFVAGVDRRRIDLARAEDRERWREDELLGLAYANLGALVEAGTELQLTRLYVDDLPMADLRLRGGGAVAHGRVIRGENAGPWTFAIAPVGRGEENRSTWRSPDLVTSDLPLTLDDRRLVQTEIEILWSVLAAQATRSDLSPRTQIPRQHWDALLAPRDFATTPMGSPFGGRGGVRDVFRKDAVLPDPAGAYSPSSIRIGPSAREATVTVRAPHGAARFQVRREQCRWWFTLDPIEIVEEE